MLTRHIVENTWAEDLCMCPSQLYRRVVKDGVHYVLYLRWRWEDPWDATIIKLNTPMQNLVEGEWEDVSIGYYFHDEYQKAEEVLLKYFEEYYETKNI